MHAIIAHVPQPHKHKMYVFCIQISLSVESEQQVDGSLEVCGRLNEKVAAGFDCEFPFSWFEVILIREALSFFMMRTCDG